MQRKSQRYKLTVLAGGLILFSAIVILEGQQGASQPPPGAAGRGGSPRPGRFKIYPTEQVSRGLPAYNSTCGYCHGERGKGGKAGPDLIASVVTLHDEDGVQLEQYVKGPGHSKNVKIDASDSQMSDIAAYLHSRIVYASGRGNVHLTEILVGDPGLDSDLAANVAARPV